MPEYIVSLERGLDEKAYDDAQKHAKDQGGTITHVYDREGVMPGFIVEFPEDSVSTLEKGPNVISVENNGQASTQ